MASGDPGLRKEVGEEGELPVHDGGKTAHFNNTDREAAHEEDEYDIERVEKVYRYEIIFFFFSHSLQ